MFMHNRKLQYTVRVEAGNPQLATLMLEQFGGPQGELAAAMRYFTQALAEDDPGRKDLFFDIATEELSHLEIIGSIITMLNKGAKGELAEGMDEMADMRNLTGNSTSQTQAILYGNGPALVNSSGVPWSAAYVDTIGEPAADLRSNIAAEARADQVFLSETYQVSVKPIGTPFGEEFGDGHGATVAPGETARGIGKIDQWQRTSSRHHAFVYG